MGAGGSAEIDFYKLMRKRGRIHGSMLRSRTREEKADVVRRLGEFIAGRELTVPVEEAFPLDRAQEAYERFKAGGKFGKIVIVPDAR